MIPRLFLITFFIIGNLQAQVSDFKEINFSRADSTAQAYAGEDLDLLPSLTYKLTAHLSRPVEKFRAIYTWICQNIENDYVIYAKNKKQRERYPYGSPELRTWNQSLQEQFFKKLKKNKKTICSGYAYLLKEMAYLADIKCEIIDGYGRDAKANIGGNGFVNHTWSAVELNGKWYLCDATWSSGYFLMPDRKYVFDYFDAYFLADPEIFARNHYPLDQKWLLLDHPFLLQEFLNAPLIYKYAFKYPIIPQAPQKMKLDLKKGTVLSFLLKAPPDFPAPDLSIEKGFGSSRFENQAAFTRNAEGLLETKYRFERLGQFDLHFVVNDKTVLTYSVRVKKK